MLRISIAILAAMAAAASPVNRRHINFPTAPGAITVVLEVLKADGANLLKLDGWRPYEAGFVKDPPQAPIRTRPGAVSPMITPLPDPLHPVWLCDNGRRRRRPARPLANDRPQPVGPRSDLRLRLQQRPTAVGGSPDNDYSLYLDLIYTDGTPLWGQTAPFRTGTHDWQRAEVKVFRTKPVKSVTVNLLLRRHAGKASFKEPQLSDHRAGAGRGDL